MTARHWRGFVICQLLSLGLLASWLFPATRSLWDSLDRTVFFALNGSLANEPTWWGWFWALLNFRLMDLLPLFALLPFLLVPGLTIQRSERATICIHLILILLVMLVIRVVVNGMTDTFHWRGYSPSRTLQPVYFLSQFYPYLNPKDGSSSSFPGDHAAVLMIVAGYLLMQGINRWSVVIVTITVFFMLPRLIAGAHWFSDVAVGGTLIAGQSLAYGFFTPWPQRWAAQIAGRY